MQFVPKGLINNIPELIQIKAWPRPGDKPLSEPIMVILLTQRNPASMSSSRLCLNYLICHTLICINQHFKSWLLMC